MFTEWIAGIFKASSGLAHPFQRHKQEILPTSSSAGLLPLVAVE